MQPTSFLSFPSLAFPSLPSFLSHLRKGRPVQVVSEKLHPIDQTQGLGPYLLDAVATQASDVK